jgi:DHA1 family purine base/nucleoside efflux pump-like MFS transporter
MRSFVSILTELARDLALSEGQAGQLVTVFSVAVAVAAPVASVVLERISRRLLFAVTLVVCP